MNKKKHKITFMILLLIATFGRLSAQDDMAIFMPNEVSFCKTITPSAHNTIVKERAVEAYDLAMGIIGVKNIGSGVVHFAKELPDNVITLIKNNRSIRAQVAEKYLDWKVAIANFDDLTDTEKQLLAKQYETWQSLEIADKTVDGSRFLTWDEVVRLNKNIFKVGDEIAGIKIERIKQGTNGKIFVIGTDMNKRIQPFAEALEKQGYKVELFNAKYQTKPFVIEGKSYTWEAIEENWNKMMERKYSNQSWIPYDAPDALKNIQETLMYKANKQFIEKAIKEGTVIDIGKTYDSHFYDMEVFNTFK